MHYTTKNYELFLKQIFNNKSHFAQSQLITNLETEFRRPAYTSINVRCMRSCPSVDLCPYRRLFRKPAGVPSPPISILFWISRNQNRSSTTRRVAFANRPLLFVYLSNYLFRFVPSPVRFLRCSAKCSALAALLFYFIFFVVYAEFSHRRFYSLP